MSSLEEEVLPAVVFVDDNIETLGTLSNRVRDFGVRSNVYSPADVDSELLRSSDLVVVDFTLDDWIDHEPVDSICLRPINGIALAAVLRQHSARLRDVPPTGFALISAQENPLGPIPAERRPHVLSRLNNVEWFFEKAAENATAVNRNAERVVSLARSISELPILVQEIGSIEALMRFLRVEKHPLHDRFRNAVQRCRPPIHHLAERSHGIVILRWLLHSILPHTTFLMDRHTLAARLCVRPAWLAKEMQPSSPLHVLFRDMEYTGPLAEFDGSRWWRDGVEQTLWERTSGESSNTDAIHRALQDLGVNEIDSADIARPVVTLSHLLEIESELSAARDVVAIHLDDWPSYAEPAYMRKKELNSHPDMRMYVAEDE